MITNDPDAFLPTARIDVIAHAKVENWLYDQFVSSIAASKLGNRHQIDTEAFEAQILKKAMRDGIDDNDQIEATIAGLPELFDLLYSNGQLLGQILGRGFCAISHGLIEGISSIPGRRTLTIAALVEGNDPDIVPPMTFTILVNAISHKADYDWIVPHAVKSLEEERSKPALHLVANGKYVTDRHIAMIAEQFAKYQTTPGAATWIGTAGVPTTPIQSFHCMRVVNEIVLCITGYFIYAAGEVTVVNGADSNTVHQL